MVNKALAYPREIEYRSDRMGFEVGGGADAREHENLENSGQDEGEKSGVGTDVW